MFVNLYYQKNTLSLRKIKKCNRYKINNITNTNSNNLVTIDNNIFSNFFGKCNLVCNNDFLNCDEHNSSISATNNTSCILPRTDFNIYSSNILTCTLIRNIVPNLVLSEPSIDVITVPPEFLRKRAVNEYVPLLYDDINGNVYIFKSFAKSMMCLQNFLPRPRSNLILWGKTVD